MHKIIMAVYMLLDFFLAVAAGDSLEEKGMNRVQHTRVNIQNERFDKAEIVE